MEAGQRATLDLPAWLRHGLELAHSGARDRALEPLQELGAVDWLAGVRMGEDEVPVGLEWRVLEEPVQLAAEHVGQGHAPSGPLRLRRPVLAPDEVPPYAQTTSCPVNVHPAKRE
jgi:hypothetical protein